LIAGLSRTWTRKRGIANILAGAGPFSERLQIRVERVGSPR